MAFDFAYKTVCQIKNIQHFNLLKPHFIFLPLYLIFDSSKPKTSLIIHGSFKTS